jgi:hypothetical protein
MQLYHMAQQSHGKYQNLTTLIISNIYATNKRIWTKLVPNLATKTTCKMFTSGEMTSLDGSPCILTWSLVAKNRDFC